MLIDLSQMPPGGQSVGLAFEDAILLARLVEHMKPANIPDVFPRLVELRKPRVDKDYLLAEQRWEGVKTISWWWQMIREFFYGIFLFFFSRHIAKSFEYDIFKQEL
jgi:salicylate hydroxylase